MKKVPICYNCENIDFSGWPLINPTFSVTQSLFLGKICPPLRRSAFHISEMNPLLSNPAHFLFHIWFFTMCESHLWLFFHAGKKLATCDVCNKSFSQLSYLRTHKRIHTGEKVATCTVCNKQFSQYGSLKVHMRVHERGDLRKVKKKVTEADLTCSECNKTFSNHGYLKLHMRVMHTTGNFACSSRRTRCDIFSITVFMHRSR